MNIGSAACFGMPYVTVYSGTKAYDMTWSNALTSELAAEGHDIETLGVIIASTKSAGNAGAQLGFAVPTSRQMASAALDRVGCMHCRSRA